MIWLKQLCAAGKLLLEILNYSEDACDLPLKKWQIADRMRMQGRTIRGGFRTRPCTLSVQGFKINQENCYWRRPLAKPLSGYFPSNCHLQFAGV
jgi:hypothetical protein